MMTARLQASSVTERLKRRAGGAILAIAVQALSIAALLFWAVPPLPRARPDKEIVFHLMPLPRPAPPVRVIGAMNAPTRKPAASAALPTAPSAATPPSGISGFGQSLFGCAPEQYSARLPQTYCPKPGDGMALNPPNDLMGGRSHVKDNARWANAMAHKQILRMLPGGMLFPLVALGAILDGSIAEPHSAFRDPEQWTNERDPAQFMPRRLDEQERINDAWNREHAASTSPAGKN